MRGHVSKQLEFSMMHLGLSGLVNTSTLPMKFLILTGTVNSCSSFSVDQHDYNYGCIFFLACLHEISPSKLHSQLSFAGLFLGCQMLFLTKIQRIANSHIKQNISSIALLIKPFRYASNIKVNKINTHFELPKKAK